MAHRMTVQCEKEMAVLEKETLAKHYADFARFQNFVRVHDICIIPRKPISLL